jgi:hypothetical protein
MDVLEQIKAQREELERKLQSQRKREREASEFSLGIIRGSNDYGLIGRFWWLVLIAGSGILTAIGLVIYQILTR